MTQYIVKQHKGHSGLSVFEWRVYSVGEHNGRRTTTQLCKFRAEAKAIEFRTKLMENSERVDLAAQRRRLT